MSSSLIQEVMENYFKEREESNLEWRKGEVQKEGNPV